MPEPQPTAYEPPVAAPVPQNTLSATPPPPPTPNLAVPILIAVVATAIIVSGVAYGIYQSRPKQTAVVPTPTPTPMATPTPVQQPSLIASSSAFLQFQASVATLSAAIAGYNPQDTSLTPPTLVLPLGFGQ